MSCIRSDADRIVVEPSAPGYPPLMLMARQPIRTEHLVRISQQLDGLYCQGKPFIMECEYMDVYQLIDGRWCLLESKVK